jgi:hypothetical protein
MWTEPISASHRKEHSHSRAAQPSNWSHTGRGHNGASDIALELDPGAQVAMMNFTREESALLDQNAKRRGASPFALP